MTNKTIIIKLIIAVFVVLALSLGITYSWLIWTSTNTNVTFTGKNYTITYDAGQNITNYNLIPTITKEEGIVKTVVVSGETGLYFNLYLDIDVLQSGLNDDDFKWAVYNGTTLLSSGNFLNAVVGTPMEMLSSQAVTSTSITYTIYLWIDGTVDNALTLANQAFNFSLNGQITNNPSRSSTSNYVIINADEYATNSLMVNLNLNSSTATTMCISNTTTCSTYVAYNDNYSWTLTSGEGTKTVYAYLKNSVGTVTTVTDTIIYDVTPPGSIATYAGGKIQSDPTFASGTNSTYRYNNTGNGTVTTSRISLDTPTNSGYALQIQTTGTPSPGWGGFYFANVSSANKVFVTRILALIPIGRTINWASNSTGDGRTSSWLTNQTGTGEWAEYVHVVTCGATGTFSTTSFFYLSGGTTPTTTAPLTWYVAYAVVVDTTLAKTTNDIIIKATDTYGVAYYGINQSNSMEPNYTEVKPTTKFATIIENITANGTYYVWLKDAAGNAVATPVTVSYIS